MDAKPFLEHVSDDEGLTDGLADPEATVLLHWLRERVTEAATSAPSEQAAWSAVRSLRAKARTISRVAQLLSEEEDPDEASRLWEKAGGKHSLSQLPAADPVAVIQQLIAWESDIA